jgi:hypothetical protein
MKSLVTVLTLASLLSATAVRAEERCAVAMTDWQPREAVARLAAEQGWTLRRIRIDDGCYLVLGTDAQGRRFEIKLHPATLAIVERGHSERDDEDHNDSKDD